MKSAHTFTIQFFRFPADYKSGLAQESNTELCMMPFENNLQPYVLHQDYFGIAHIPRYIC